MLYIHPSSRICSCSRCNSPLVRHREALISNQHLRGHPDLQHGHVGSTLRTSAQPYNSWELASVALWLFLPSVPAKPLVPLYKLHARTPRENNRLSFGEASGHSTDATLALALGPRRNSMNNHMYLALPCLPIRAQQRYIFTLSKPSAPRRTSHIRISLLGATV